MSGDRKIPRSELIKKLSNHAIYLVKGDRSIEEYDPYIFLNKYRFDLPAKYIYAKFRDMGWKSSWGERVYEEHLRIFNGYHELDGSGKKGFRTFINAYEELLDSVKKDGFDSSKSIIPLGNNHTIIDGGHRTAACLYYGKKVNVVKLNNQPNYDYQYFRNSGLTDKWCDAIALEYCRLKKNTYVAVVFPSAIGKTESIKKILNEYGSIYYEKRLFLKKRGGTQLIKQLYLGDGWIGDWSDQFAGAKSKAKASFKNKEQPVRIYVYESSNLHNVRKAKEKIRKLFNLGNNSIHINDTHEETVQLAQIVFNSNTVHFLNHAKLNAVSKAFYDEFINFKKALAKRNMDPDNYCIVSSSVMGIYGIRKPADLDYLVYGPDALSNQKNEFNNHEKELRYYTKTKDDIIFNPENHFYFEGIKFASIDVIKEMKRKRGEAKDHKDIELIDSFLRIHKK